MEAEAFLAQIERSIPSLLPSIDMLKLRPANDVAWLSFSLLPDFLAAARAAAGANIAVTL